MSDSLQYTRPQTPPGKIDLHTHTTASDGRLTPAELVDLAVERGVTLLAVTDHDTTNGLDAAMARASAVRLEVWPGVEISTDVPGTEVHVLGYFVNHRSRSFESTLRRMRESRLDRAEGMVRKLADLGMPITWEQDQALAGDATVGRPHVAQARVASGYVASFREAFDRYIGRNGPAYVEREKLTPAEAVALIKATDGMPVLAHPVFIVSTAETGRRFDYRAYLPELV
ncbi:MAG: PHP domain-containing protein, partial [Actinobacteria bacterium]|nr:PHP domain-containing protein [Actinomycetota bacterium]